MAARGPPTNRFQPVNQQGSGPWTSSPGTGPTQIRHADTGDPDPEEFGLARIEQDPPQADLNLELIPLEQVHFEPEDRVTESATNIWAHRRRDRRDRSQLRDRFWTRDPPATTRNWRAELELLGLRRSGNGHRSQPVRFRDLRIFIAAGYNTQPGSVNGQLLQDARDSSVALWPETSLL